MVCVCVKDNLFSLQNLALLQMHPYCFLCYNIELARIHKLETIVKAKQSGASDAVVKLLEISSVTLGYFNEKE